MPEFLIDAELFGYEAGAFTGARRDGSKGLIVQADGGTLFLDEIGDMPIALQTRLLRVLENREVWPLGALKLVAVDIRLISATHRDLGRMAEAGSFRADLYYRLRGLEIRLPALRERADKADLIALIAREEAPDCRLAPAAPVDAAGLSLPGKHAAAPPRVAARRLHGRGRRHHGCRSRSLPPFGGRAARAEFRGSRTRRNHRSAAQPWRARH